MQAPKTYQPPDRCSFVGRDKSDLDMASWRVDAKKWDTRVDVPSGLNGRRFRSLLTLSQVDSFKN